MPPASPVRGFSVQILEMKPGSRVMDSASGRAAAVRAGPIISVGKVKWICSRLGMMNLLGVG
ncbi:hypothetical protein D3C84_1089870 [compost metagenome]